MFRSFSKIMHAFAHDTQGAVVAIVALGLVALVGAVGVAVDAGRAHLVESKLQSAVDSAGLAAGAAVSTADINALATKYVQLNFNPSGMGATLGTVKTVVSSNNQIVTISASATLPTTFMKIFGRKQVAIGVSSEITRSNKGIELVMVLDTTGSMAGSKITALKSAAHSLVGILFGSNASSENVWVGMVPFSQTVNIGTNRSSWLDGTTFNWGSSSWKGCVDARATTGRDITDDPPSLEKLRAYYWEDDINNDWILPPTTTTTTTCSKKSSCTCANWGPCAVTTSGNVTTTLACTGSGSSASCTKKVDTINYSITETGSTQKGPNAYCPAAVMGLTNQKSTIDTGIDTIYAAGNTHVNFGAVWGWRMLSPRWRGLWGGTMNTNNLPLDYNAPLMQKAIIIMTDGTNTMTAGTNGGRGVRTAYGFLDEGKLGTTNATTAVTKLNQKLTSVCNSLKAQNVLVYTILFQETNGTIQTLLRSCATTPDYFFNSPSESELQAAFRTIGDSLANLRISR